MDEDQREVIRLLGRANELLTVLAKAALAEVLTKELSTPKNRELYRLTGGEMPVKDISARVKVAVGTISKTWQRWDEMGLLVKDGHRYRRVLG